MKILLIAAMLVLVFISGAEAWDENHCFWDGREMHCRHGWTWQERREWREEEWREHHREHERERDRWDYGR